MDGLRAYLIERLEGELTEISITKPERAAPHILNITLPRIKSETMLHFLSSRGIYVSSGSACSSNTGHISGTLVSFGLSETEADSTIRVSLCPENTLEEADVFLAKLLEGAKKLVTVKR
jgi:cysteine desulfurase